MGRNNMGRDNNAFRPSSQHMHLLSPFIHYHSSIAEPEQVQVLEGLATLLSRRTPTPISKDVAHAALHALAQQQLGPSCFFAPGLLSQLCSTLQECAAWDAEREQAANPWGQPCVVEACLALAQLCRQVSWRPFRVCWHARPLARTKTPHYAVPWQHAQLTLSCGRNACRMRLRPPLGVTVSIRKDARVMDHVML